MKYDVVVIGAGLAGSSLAAQLSLAGFRVLLLEKQTYPAEKLCGEFLSTEVQSLFQRLGVLDAVLVAGARPITEAFVTTADGALLSTPLPGRALGLSRSRLDALLFEHALRSGVDARQGCAVEDVAGSLDHGFVVEAAGERFGARLVVGAYGKRDRLDRRLERMFLQKRTALVGFKAHYTGIDLPGVVELHAFDGGYCGLLPVEDGRINACWISDVQALKRAGGDPDRMIRSMMRENPYLAVRFSKLKRVSTGFQAVSEVSFARKELFAGDVCMVGDAAAMIAPLCGDGMAMALQSAELAAPLATAFLEGRFTAAAFRAGYADAWADEFRGRVRLGRWLHRGLCHPVAATVGVRACRAVPALARWFIQRTRGPASSGTADPGPAGIAARLPRVVDGANPFA